MMDPQGFESAFLRQKGRPAFTPVSAKERTLLRDLAKRVKALAEAPIMAERRDLWRRHNRLEHVRPLVIVFPEGCWRELQPESALQCESAAARYIEDNLRAALRYDELIRDDTVIEAQWDVHKVIHETGWGLNQRWTPSVVDHGAGTFDPVLHTKDDLKKLRAPEVTYDETTTMRNLEQAEQLFGDILDVQLKGVTYVSFHFTCQYSMLRGLDQMLEDFCTNPEFVHETMTIFEEGHRRVIQQYCDLNLLSLNNDGAYNATGGVGYTDELPAPGFDGEHVRPCDMWASSEAQEMAVVGPAMHEEFVLQYERRLLEPFGLTGYGCCEDLSQKFDYVFKIPNLRRISISPFVRDLAYSAERLGNRYIFSWKPHPSHLVGDFDEAAVRKYIQHTLDVTHGCVLEMVLKDVHTCENHPERFTQWTTMAQKLIENY